MPNFIVIGAGVSGLTTSLQLLKANPQNRVKLISKQIPTDFQFSSNYTSPFAGANWESFATHEDKWQQEIDLVAYHKFKELAKVPESGVVDRVNTVWITKEKFKQDNEVVDYPWFSTVPEMNFKKLESQDDKIAYGYSFDGVVISTTYYLSYLWNECHRIGGPSNRFTLQRKTVKSLADLTTDDSNPDFIINCTGLLARDLVSPTESTKLYTIRGVTILVENNLDQLYVVQTAEPDYPDEMLYIMPRKEGGCVVGGCMETGKDSQTTSLSSENRLGLDLPEKVELDWSWMMSLVR
ncbi:unnamed protein product [Ambrosiozyma monospora]|uniref:Unnamed protein product n=1 Tax=Ambrosiozyma monospora TaxID=43982 RepID=A0ACB5SUN6_AMBMO|nr:unnamed protein product [Ambrosiozyma monospora]